MDLINTIISWLEQNWDVAIFGGMSLSAIVGTVTLLVKMWLGNTKLGNTLTAAFDQFEEKYSRLEKLYHKSQEDAAKKDMALAVSNHMQVVMFEGMTKLILASKLDSEDKAGFIGTVEKFKLMKPEDIIKESKELVDGVVTNITENPAEVIVDVVKKAETLYDKYNTKGE